MMITYKNSVLFSTVNMLMFLSELFHKMISRLILSWMPEVELSIQHFAWNQVIWIICKISFQTWPYEVSPCIDHMYCVMYCNFYASYTYTTAAFTMKSRVIYSDSLNFIKFIYVTDVLHKLLFSFPFLKVFYMIRKLLNVLKKTTL